MGHLIAIDISAINLSALVERDGVTLRGQPDRERYGACPKCGGKDRFHLRRYNDRDYFFCRKCHERRGDAIEYLRWLHGLSYPDALRELGIEQGRPSKPLHRRTTPKTSRGVVIPDKLDEPPPAEWQTTMQAFVDECAARLWTPAAAKALAYLHARGIGDDTIRCFNLGFSATDDFKRGTWRGITIPITYAGALWAVNTRRATGEPKYRKVTGSKSQLFNGDVLAGHAHTVIVCAGEFDAILAAKFAPAGVACITFGSETKMPTWEVDYLLRDRRVLIAFDNDAAGESGAAHWATIGQRVYVPSGKDITDYWQAGGDVAAWIVTTTSTARGDISTEMPNESQPDAPPAAEIVTEIEPPADEIAVIATSAIVGYLASEGWALPSKLAQHVALAAGWELTAGVKAQIAGAMKALVKSGRVVQRDDKRLALAQG